MTKNPGNFMLTVAQSLDGTTKNTLIHGVAHKPAISKLREILVLCFFFSSRRRHTRWTGDWSSDVCSSDLTRMRELLAERLPVYEGLAWVTVATDERAPQEIADEIAATITARIAAEAGERSEERRVGKECRAGWSPEAEKKKEQNRDAKHEH